MRLVFAALPEPAAPCCDRVVNDACADSRFGLGLDAGGTATRWLLIDVAGRERARGEVAGFSATQLGTVQQPQLDAVLGELSAAVRAQPRPSRVYGGVTGFDGRAEDAPGALHQRLAQTLGIDAVAVALVSDIELACRATFAPGRGILVMAGTGSIAAHLRADGSLERALFAQIGGEGWACTREFVASATRGEFGALATAVAAAARAGDADAQVLLHRAGTELARLALALTARCGAQPVALAGRVATLDDRIVAALRDALPAAAVTLAQPDGARAAAFLALGLAPPLAA